MKIYDSLLNKANDLKNKEVNIYSCGPTVYNYIHIGNARPALLMDVLVRFLESQNIKVNYLQNITDIDDKIINKAIEENLTEKELSEKYTKAYIADLKSLNVKMPTKLLPISHQMESMISFIADMVKTGDAYEVDGDVYFDIKKYQNQYGKLSGRNIEELISGERVDIDIKKHNPLDFTLWKKTNKGIKWNSSFGEGRPGWHTECVLLINNYFKGETVDIHAGGIDLKFPHHENERIQFIAHNGLELAHNWVHNGHLTIEDEKMSKSVGNIILVKDFVKNYNPNLLRWIFLTTYYRQPLNINDDLIFQGNKFFEKIENLRKKIIAHLMIHGPAMAMIAMVSIPEEFNKYMNDDLNTPMVLYLIEKTIKDINKQMLDGNHPIWLTMVSELKTILTTLGFENLLNLEFTNEDKELYLEWKKLLSNKEFDKADVLRDELKRKDLV